MRSERALMEHGQNINVFSRCGDKRRICAAHGCDKDLCGNGAGGGGIVDSILEG